MLMIIRVNKELYSKEVLLKTAYSLTDKVYLHLDQDENDWLISWKLKENQNIDEGEFENELIAQSLREKLINQTADIRKLILARAFASTMMDDQQSESAFVAPEHKEEKSQDNLVVSSQEVESILKGWFDQP